MSDRGEPGLTYFRTATDAWPPGATDPEVKGFRPGLLPGAGRVWGFAAAVLGSRDRVGQFEKVVGRYLSTGADGGHLLQALREPPPAGAWEAAWARFRRADQAVQQALDTLERARSDLAELARLRRGVADRARRRQAAEAALAAAIADQGVARDAVTRFEGAAAAAMLRVDVHDRGRSPWWARWLRTRASRDWHAERRRLEQLTRDTGTDLAARQEALWTAWSG